MRTRIKLFRATGGDRGTECLREGLATASYDPAHGRGFRLSSSSVKRIEGEHIIKRERKFVSFDIDGEEVKQSVLFYEHVRFDFDLGNGVLNLIDPPRSTKAFFRDLSVASGHSLALSELSLNVRQCVEVIKAGFAARLLGIEAKDVSFSRELRYRISVFGVEGLGDNLENLPFQVPSTYRKAKMEISEDGDSMIIEIRDTGVLVLSSPAEYPILDSVVRLISDSVF